jgi:hypothetical protein
MNNQKVPPNISTIVPVHEVKRLCHFQYPPLQHTANPRVSNCRSVQIKLSFQIVRDAIIVSVISVVILSVGLGILKSLNEHTDVF